MMTNNKPPENTWSINTSSSHLPELAPYFIAQFRESIKLQTDCNFKIWEDEFPAKMPVDILLKLVESTVVEAMKTQKSFSTDVRRLDLSSKTIEFSASRFTLTGSSPHPGNSAARAYGWSWSETWSETCVAVKPPELESKSQILECLKIFVRLNDDRNDYYDIDDKIHSEAIIFGVEVAGIDSIVNEFVSIFKAELKKIHDESQTSMIRWIFDSGHGHRDRTFQITKDWKIDRSFYPWIETDLNDYYRSFMESQAQILIVYGPPGTGKTTFIRDMICELNLNAFISYDIKVLTSDSTFVRYLTDTIFDAVIIEDADDLLTSDRGEHNKIIAKILNISDGLIKLPKKKLIFSTNLERIEDIDQAIVRPGRCFDVMEFRQLTKDEAQTIATKVGIDLPTKKSGEYSLAELFYENELKNSKDPFTRHHAEKLKKRTIGFNTQ